MSYAVPVPNNRIATAPAPQQQQHERKLKPLACPKCGMTLAESDGRCILIGRVIVRHSLKLECLHCHEEREFTLIPIPVKR